MKFKIFTLLIASLILVECTENHDAQVEQVLTGIARFNSPAEFETEAAALGKMTDSELDAWEQGRSFVSMRKVLLNARREWSSITSEEERRQFVARYSDVLALQDSSIVPHIAIEHIQSYVNRQGIYITETFANRVLGEYVISCSTKHIDDLLAIEDVNQIQDNGTKFRIQRYTGESPNSSSRSMVACATFLQGTYFLNESSCRDDREAFVSAQSYLEPFNGSGGTTTYSRVKLRVWGRYRNGWCTWHDYETQLEYRNTSFSIYARERLTSTPTYSTSQLKLYSLSLSDNSVEDEYELKWDTPIGDWVFNESIVAQPFTSLHIEGKSRGIDNNWIVINCP